MAEPKSEIIDMLHSRLTPEEQVQATKAWKELMPKSIKTEFEVKMFFYGIQFMYDELARRAATMKIITEMKPD